MSTNPFARTPQSAGGGTSKFNESAPPGQLRLPSRLSDDRTKAIPFGRLFSVELRKLVDTRAGRWLLIAIAALILIASTAVLLNDTDLPPQYSNFIAAAGIPMGVLLPVLGILAVTSEWSQRTGLVTFTLEPRRVRVGLAKWAAALFVGALSVALAFGVGALFTILAQVFRGISADWSIHSGAIWGNLLAELLGVTTGIAFGMLLQNTPAAICAFFFLPTLVTLVTSFPTFKNLKPWIDRNAATTPLYDGTMTGSQWSHFAVATLLWTVLPLIGGLWRLTHREVKSS